jgi:hypothetical protein
VRSGSQGCPTRERSSRVFPPPTQDAFPLRGGLGQHVQTGATPLPPLRGGPGRGARSARGVDPDATSALMQRSSARRSRVDRRWRAVPRPNPPLRGGNAWCVYKRGYRRWRAVPHPSPPLRGGNAWCVFRRGFPPEPTRRSGARPHPPGAAGCPQTAPAAHPFLGGVYPFGPARRHSLPSGEGRAGRTKREGRRSGRDVGAHAPIVRAPFPTRSALARHTPP